ncbi:hypothetical protein [Sphingopyxis macrogoltabida]|uniref:Colicin transporter n=1 Tax=Sphingopyxis macrogoltabida TaxID=33050 RepID=A0AAC9FF73_SPHMC|nr:hypothetical protein [Sphingopyxis macrogoltabida]ALJ13971.1 hypothetical protein LH19_13945 [Sphingopyxis macrogoltabida]AMU88593.1 hypothetical protein ATM17_05990 [Sphingopyxis macrogoltabida]
MLMAARKLQGIGLVLLVLIIAMMLYPVSLKVAATRSELAKINRQIERTRDNIRYLESELAVRASMRQLEQWNADTFGYSAPSADQYLSNERQLASLDRLPRARGANEVAPVLMAMVSPVGTPAVGTPAKVETKPEAVKAPAAKPVQLAQADIRGDDVRSDAAPRLAPTRRREQLKMIEDQLLAESTLADLKRAAAREAMGGQ